MDWYLAFFDWSSIVFLEDGLACNLVFQFKLDGERFELHAPYSVREIISS